MFWIRVLVRLMGRPAAASPSWEARPHRVLFLRHDRAGDMILSTALLRRIAESYDTIELHVLASPGNASILDHARYVRKVIVFDKRKIGSYLATLRALRAKRYDAVIDCMVTAPSLTTLLLMAAAGAPYRIGIAGRGNDDAINVQVPGASAENHITEKLGMLSAAFGIDPERADWSPEIVLTEKERATAGDQWGLGIGRSRVLVNLSAGTANRRWPEERYVAVIRHIRERRPSADVLLIAAPDESGRADAVARGSGARVMATPRLRDALALVATADFVLTPDTSIAHAASAFRRPCVGLYSALKTGNWGLYRTPGEMVVYEGEMIEVLSVADVVAAVDRVLVLLPFE